MRQHTVGWVAGCGSSPNPVSPVVCVASKRLRFAVADRPDAQISAFELIGGHDFDVHDLLITAALDGSLNVRNQVTCVHGAEALDSEAVSDVHRDLTLSLSRRGLDTLSIVYVRCNCTARRNCDVTQRCTPAWLWPFVLDIPQHPCCGLSPFRGLAHQGLHLFYGRNAPIGCRCVTLHVLSDLAQSLCGFFLCGPRLGLHLLQVFMDGGQVGDALELCNQGDCAINDQPYEVYRNGLVLRAVDTVQRVSQILRETCSVPPVFQRPNCLLRPRSLHAFEDAQGDAPDITALQDL